MEASKEDKTSGTGARIGLGNWLGIGAIVVVVVLGILVWWLNGGLR